MAEFNVFVSVGGTATEQQEAFVRAVEERLRAEGLNPHTVGRNVFSSDAPLKTINELLDRCVGTVIIALERVYFSDGIEKRGGPKETTLSNVRLATPWTQIEAAMAYSRGHQPLVIVEEGVRNEGLLEHAYGWYVQSVKAEAAALNSSEFNGVLASWKSKLATTASPTPPAPVKSASEMTVYELLKGLKAKELYSLGVAVAAILAGAFGLGAKLFGS